MEEDFLVGVDLFASDNKLVFFDRDVQFIAVKTCYRKRDAKAIVRQFFDVIGRITVAGGLRRTFQQTFQMVEAQKKWAVEIYVSIHVQSPPGALPAPIAATGNCTGGLAKERRIHIKRWELAGQFQAGWNFACATLCPEIAPLPGTGQKPLVSTPIVLLDGPESGRLLRFAAPLAIVRADDPADVGPALAVLEEVRAQGRFVAGYFAYELGYLLEPRLAPMLPEDRHGPMLWFGVFDGVEAVDAPRAEGRAYAGPLRHEWPSEAYRARFDRTHRYIADGDIYQANLSFRSRFRFAGDPMALWLALRAQSSVAHGAFVADGERHILSLSPELFFRISQSGALTAKPMKGTAPRASEPSADAAARAHLSMSAKDRAENLMIVDLLRNDLGRIARTGSVAVEDLFAVETYPTLHTMVSTVTAQLKPRTTISEIVHALFPCGSITGAPKIRAMEIIRELEASPRGVYCGAIGYFAPDGSASFNVAIRTLTLQGNEGELGIGGGIVWDSHAGAEYDECLLKARYYEAARKPLGLIETLRFDPGKGFTRLHLHLERMEASAEAFGIAFDRSAALHALENAVAGAGDARRVRLTLDEQGQFACTTAALDECMQHWTYAVSPLRANSQDLLLRHKTTWREMYEAEHSRLARETGCDEVLFLNERGEVTEGSRTNVFVRIGGMLFTPFQSCGLLNGCLRQEMLSSGKCEERSLTLAELEKNEVWLGNSLRGLIRAQPVSSV